jgi:hypothetical protein
MPRSFARLVAAGAVALAWPAVSRAVPPKTTCTADDKPIAFRQPEGLVATKPLIGTELNLHLWADNLEQIPYLNLTADWKRLKKKVPVTLAIEHPSDNAAFDVLWSEKAIDPKQPARPPDYAREGEYVLDHGTLKITKRAASGALDLALDLWLKVRIEHPDDTPADRQRHVTCRFESLPIKEIPPP